MIYVQDEKNPSFDSFDQSSDTYNTFNNIVLFNSCNIPGCYQKLTRWQLLSKDR